MEDAPTTFENNGKKYTGRFSSVGTGQNEGHLMDRGNFYLGNASNEQRSMGF
jgi:hypothetical protein